MKLFLNRLQVMLKRNLKQPISILMLLLLLVLTFLYTRIPAKEKTANIPVAILNLDTSGEGERFTNDLLTKKSIYAFYTVSSEEELYNAILSGEANMGYLIPADFFASCTSLSTIQQIHVYTTEGTLLHSLANEEVYSSFYRYAAPLIVKEAAAADSEYSTLDPAVRDEEIDRIYEAYMEGDQIFTVEDVTGDKYNTETSQEAIELPIRKLAGFFIFTTALLGVAAYLTDYEHKLYFTLSTGQRISLKLIQILTAVLPISLVSFLCLLLIQEMPAGKLLLHVLLYTLVVVLLAFVLSLLFKKSTSFYKVLPVILIFALLFGGIFFDLSDYDSRLKAISMLFLPYYF